MTIEIGLLLAIIGGFIGLAGWLSGRDKKIANDSEWKGMVNAKLDIAVGIRKDYEDLSDIVLQHSKDIVALQHDIDSIKESIQ